MKESERIGILLFLYTCGELSPAEQEELMTWRGQDPENEKLFFQMTDPDSVRTMMQAYYQERDRDFEKLQVRLPYLSKARLSGSVDEATEIFSGTQVWEEDDQPDLSGNDAAASELSPVEYWGSLISRLDDTKETDRGTRKENKVLQMTPGGKTLRVRRKGRPFRVFLRVACILILVLAVDFFFSDSKYKNYKAEMVSSDGVRIMLDDFHRGYLAGLAGIKFGETDKGEPIYIANNERREKKNKFYTLLTPPGGEFILQLPDGTVVWLNAASTIQYPANFTRDTIRIEVEGEAYFEMSKDSSHHFLISVNARDTADKATNANAVNGHWLTINVQPSSGININTYPGNGEMLVTLIRGAAAANLDSGETHIERPFQLLYGKMALIVHDTLVLTRDVDATEITAWKNGELYYKEADLSVMMPAIAKWYDVDIEYPGRIPDKKFSLRVPRSAPLSEVLDSLQKQGLHITRKGKSLIIWK